MALPLKYRRVINILLSKVDGSRLDFCKTVKSAGNMEDLIIKIFKESSQIKEAFINRDLGSGLAMQHYNGL